MEQVVNGDPYWLPAKLKFRDSSKSESTTNEPRAGVSAKIEPKARLALIQAVTCIGPRHRPSQDLQSLHLPQSQLLPRPMLHATLRLL